MSGDTKPAKVISLNTKRAAKFLEYLKTHPFIALVLVGDEVKLYTKGIELDNNALRKIEVTLHELATEGIITDAD